MIFIQAQFKSPVSIFPRKHENFQTIKSGNKHCNKQKETEVEKDGVR